VRRAPLSRNPTDSTISAAGICSVIDSGEAANLLRWKGSDGPAPAMCFPYLGLGGNAVTYILRPDEPRERDDGSRPKYESPLGLGPRLYFAPPSLVSPAVYRDPAQPLLLIEGMKKLLCAVQAGAVAPISAQGVTVWHDVERKRQTKDTKLHPDLRQLPLEGRLVYVAFDAGDTAENPAVMHAEARLAQMLVGAGAIPMLLRPPFVPGGPKVGLDDYLVTQPDPTAALRELMADAVPGDLMERVRSINRLTERDEKVDAMQRLLLDRSFAGAVARRT
jgi:Domain of unknown function (DUF3854)